MGQELVIYQGANAAELVARLNAACDTHAERVAYRALFDTLEGFPLESSNPDEMREVYFSVGGLNLYLVRNDYVAVPKFSAIPPPVPMMSTAFPIGTPRLTPLETISPTSPSMWKKAWAALSPTWTR